MNAYVYTRGIITVRGNHRRLSARVGLPNVPPHFRHFLTHSLPQRLFTYSPCRGGVSQAYIYIHQRLLVVVVFGFCVNAEKEANEQGRAENFCIRMIMQRPPSSAGRAVHACIRSRGLFIGRIYTIYTIGERKKLSGV